MEKIVALAAMPRPIETMTASTMPGDCRSRRKAWATSYRQAVMMFYTASYWYAALESIDPAMWDS
jgi:hypothetical protein